MSIELYPCRSTGHDLHAHCLENQPESFRGKLTATLGLPSSFPLSFPCYLLTLCMYFAADGKWSPGTDHAAIAVVSYMGDAIGQVKLHTLVELTPHE